MKVRSGFVSNSSSSSFICSVDNTKDSWTEDMVRLNFLDDSIADAEEYGSDDDYERLTNEKKYWISYAKENNVYLFDLFFNDFVPDNFLEELENKIPNFKIVKENEL